MTLTTMMFIDPNVTHSMSRATSTGPKKGRSTTGLKLPSRCFIRRPAGAPRTSTSTLSMSPWMFTAMWTAAGDWTQP